MGSSKEASVKLSAMLFPHILTKETKKGLFKPGPSAAWWMRHTGLKQFSGRGLKREARMWALEPWQDSSLDNYSVLVFYIFVSFPGCLLWISCPAMLYSITLSYSIHLCPLTLFFSSTFTWIICRLLPKMFMYLNVIPPWGFL